MPVPPMLTNKGDRLFYYKKSFEILFCISKIIVNFAPIIIIKLIKIKN